MRKREGFLRALAARGLTREAAGEDRVDESLHTVEGGELVLRGSTGPASR